MATRSFQRVHWCPWTLVIFMITGILTVFLVAVLREDVTPYVPFISETGAKPPEAGIFSIVLYFSAVFGMILMVIRYMVIEECHQGLNRIVGIVNLVALPIGILSMFGMVIVAAYPMITIIEAHMAGAFLLFIGTLVYGIFHSVISYQLHPSHNSRFIFGLRVAIIILSIASFFMMVFGAGEALREFKAANLSYWSGSKKPNDPGFRKMVVAASGEWLMLVFFLAFFATFVAEFKNTNIHFGVQLTVSHFDDEGTRRRYTGSL